MACTGSCGSRQWGHVESRGRGSRVGASPVSYVIAAYAIVLGSLVLYGVWVARQRRALMRRPPDASDRAGSGDGD